MPQILMPRLSDSMEEGTIVKWLQAAGSEVSSGDALAEIETDKAVMTYEAESSGRLEIVAEEGSTLPVGAVIAAVLGAGERLSDGAADAAGAAPAAGALQATSALAPASAVAARGAEAGSGLAAADGAGRSHARQKASPLARRLADALGVDLASLAGTGPSGRIVKRDVEGARAASNGAAIPAAGTTAAGSSAARAAGAAAAPAPAAAAPAPAAPAPAAPAPAAVAPAPATAGSAPSAAAKGAVTAQPLTRTQAVIARRMAEAKATMPEFTLSVEVDMDEAVAFRERLKAVADGPAPSFNDLVVKACAVALRKHPRANGAFADGGFELFERVNIGVAVAAGDALLVPTVLDADKKSLGAIAKDTRRLAELAREGRLEPSHLSGGTFTVSNLGMFGIDSFTAVLNPPQAAILAVGALALRPAVRDGAVVAAHRMTITLTCDHRILYGADAAVLLADVRDQLQQPLRLTL